MILPKQLNFFHQTPTTGTQPSPRTTTKWRFHFMRGMSIPHEDVYFHEGEKEPLTKIYFREGIM
jgi:hypothetical protein